MRPENGTFALQIQMREREKERGKGMFAPNIANSFQMLQGIIL